MVNFLFKANLFKVKNNFSNVFSNAFDCCKFVVCTSYVNSYYCITF